MPEFNVSLVVEAKLYATIVVLANDLEEAGKIAVDEVTTEDWLPVIRRNEIKILGVDEG